MTLRRFILQLVTVVLITWILGSIIESFAWALYFALMPFGFYEMLRSRPPRPGDDDKPNKAP